jgi:hypothetical protein
MPMHKIPSPNNNQTIDVYYNHIVLTQYFIQIVFMKKINVVIGIGTKKYFKLYFTIMKNNIFSVIP